MESYFPVIDRSDPRISKANIGWHIAHSLKVINGVCSALKASDPGKYQSQFNFKREIVFMLGAFPRGKAKAPKQVLPEGEIVLEDLKDQLTLAKKNLARFNSLDQNNYFEHPYFNQLNKIQAKRLLEVHTKHHLKIIKDIMKGDRGNKKLIVTSDKSQM